MFISTGYLFPKTWNSCIERMPSSLGQSWECKFSSSDFLLLPCALNSSYSHDCDSQVYLSKAQMVKNPPAMQETWLQSLGREDPPEKRMATHSTILAWEIPRTKEPGRLQSKGLQRVRHD